MKHSLLLLLILVSASLIPSVVNAQANYEDVVYLKNGSIIHGMIIEQVPNESIKIQTKDKNIFVFGIDEVLKITKEEIPTPEKKSPEKKVPVSKTKKVRGYTNITEGSLSRSFIKTESVNDANGQHYYYESHFDIINNGPSIGIETVNGYQFNPNFSVGAGIGMHAYRELILIPVYVDFRVIFMDGRVSPFADAEIGNSFTHNDLWGLNINYDDEGGFMGTFSAGVKFFPVPDFALNFSIGFRYQEVTVENNDEEYVYPYYNSQDHSKKSMNRFMMKMGFTF